MHILDKKSDGIITTLNSEKGEILQALLFDSISNVSYFDFTAARKFDALEKRNRVLVQNQDGHFNEFIITYAEQYKRNEKIVKANASYVDLAKAKVINPTTLQGATSSAAVAFALDSTEWQSGDIEYTFIRTITIENHTDPYSLLKLIASTFDLEITYRVEVAENKIVGRYVDMKRQTVGFEGKEITFGKDLIGVKRIEDSSNVVTALQGIGPEKEDKTRLTAFVSNEEAFQRWNRKGRHIVQVYEPESSDQNMTEARLRELTEAALQKRIDSVVSYECEVASLEHIAGRSHEKIRKGQTVRIKDEGYTPPLYLEARIDDIETDPLSNNILSFKIGSFTAYSRSDLEQQIKTLREVIKQKASNADIQNAVQATENNLIEYVEVNAEKIIPAQKIAPSNPVLGEKWVDTSLTPNVLKLFNGAAWTSVKGDKGDTGATGPQGPNIVDSTTEIEANVIKSNHIEVANLSALSANLGEVTTGNMTGVAISLGGNSGNGRLTVMDSSNEVIADLDASRGGFDELYIGKVNSPSVVNVNSVSRNFYVDPLNGNDENSGVSLATALKTVQAAIDKIPRYNAGDIVIYLHYDNSRNFYEDIKINGLVGPGSVTIEAQTTLNTLTGGITVSSTTNYIAVKNLKINSSTGKAFEVYNSIYVLAENVHVYGQANGRGFFADYGSNLHLINCQSWDSALAIYSMRLSKILVHNCKGLGSQRGIAAQNGGEIRISGTYPGGTISATYVDSGGTIIGTTTETDNTGKGTVPPVQFTKTVNAIAGSNYSELYNNWESGSVKQGNYGYGNRRGLWFFGTSILDTIGTGKTIKAMRVLITRTSRGGTSGAVRHSIRGHAYASQPSGNPSLSNEMASVNLAWGQSAWVNIPSSWWANFANGTHRGFGLYTDGSNYSLCSTSCTVEITYQ